MVAIDSVMREIALRTSRRTILAKTGRALIGASLLTVIRATEAHAAVCSACDGTLYCDGTAACTQTAASWSTCCQGPDTIKACNPDFAAGGSWCGGSPEAWHGTCQSGTPNWYWLCCIVDRETGATYKYKCQDCCINSVTCTTRVLLGNC